MKKILSIFAASLVALAVSATPVVLPATLDVSNVSFRSENMPDYVIEEGDYAGTYFDMGAHDSANDTLLYAEWDVTIEPIKYNIAVDVYNENSWRVQLYVLNQAGDTVKGLRYKGSSGKSGQFAIGSIDMRDLAAGDYKVRAHAATAWSKMKLKDVIFEGDYQGVNVDLPGTLLPAYAELSANASISNHAIAFKPSTAPDEYALWNVSFAAAGSYNVSIDMTAPNGHTYGVALLSADGQTQIGAVAEAQSWDTGVKELGAIEVPAAGSYIVKLTNATVWSEAVLNSITFAGNLPAEPQVLYLKPGVWYWPDNNEKFAIYAWADGKEAVWSNFMTLAENETDIWTGTIPADYTNVIFVRFGNASQTPSWEDNMWNKTFDLTIEEDKDMYTISGWGEYEGAACPGEWSKYGEIIPEVKFYISGSMTDWTPSTASYEDSYVLALEAGDYQLKVVTTEGAWIGYSQLTEEYKAAELYPNQDDNVCFTLAEAGNVTVTYIKDGVYKVEGNFVPAEVKLMGIAGWTEATDAIIMNPAEDHKTASAVVNLEAWYYEFKLIVAGAWLGKENKDGLYGLHREWTSVDGLTYAGDNIKLTMDENDKVPGDYTFTWEYATGKLTVTFPAAPVVEEWAEIVFTAAATADEIAEEASYAAQGSEFALTLHDAGNKMVIDENACRFGTAEAYSMYNFRIKSGGASSSTKNYFTLNIPKAGTLRIAPRTGSNSATDRALVIAQGESELYNAIVQESQAIEVIENEQTVKVYPYVEVPVAAGEVRVSYSAGMNFYAFAFLANGTTTDIINTKVNEKAVKMIENGQLIIIKNGVRYNVMGTVVH